MSQAEQSKTEMRDLEERMVQILARWMSGAAAAGVVQSDFARQQAVHQLEDTSAQLEVFSGSRGLSSAEWIDRLELAKEVGRWSEAKTRSVLLAKLAAQPRTWHLKHGVQVATFDEWKAKFLKEHSSQHRMQRFLGDATSHDWQQGIGEILQVYVWRSAAMAAHRGLAPDDVKAQVLRGLLPEYHVLVHQLHGRTHADVADLMKDIVQSTMLRPSVAEINKGLPYQLRIRWQPMRGGSIPENAVQGGVDGNGETNYVARAVHEGDLIPGRVVSTGQAYVPYESEEYRKEHYEVLLADCDTEWIECDGGRQPTGIIQGGWTKEGEALYIGRAHHDNYIINGKVQFSKRACFISFNGSEWCYENFDVLACRTIRLV